MALHHGAIDAEEHGAIVASRVYLLAQGMKGTARQQVTQPAAPGIAQSPLEEVAIKLAHALGGLECNISGETVCDDDICRALGKIVALNEAVVDVGRFLRLA